MFQSARSQACLHVHVVLTCTRAGGEACPRTRCLYRFPCRVLVALGVALSHLDGACCPALLLLLLLSLCLLLVCHYHCLVWDLILAQRAREGGAQGHLVLQPR